MGLDFADPTNQSKAEEAYKYAEEILGSQGSLLGVQMGNEPDLYASSSARRTGEWNISLYETQLTTAMDNIAAWDSSLPMDNFMLPSVCWCVALLYLLILPHKSDLTLFASCHQLMDTRRDDRDGTARHLRLADERPLYVVLSSPRTPLAAADQCRFARLFSAFQKYPFDNCDAASGETGQNIFSQYLNHTLATSLVYEYEAAANEGAARGLDVIMAETNSASCSGFAGLSDSFGIAMWLTDWAFTLAYRNFTSALLHTGGQSAYYNPFTPPATNESSFKQWTTGSPFYSSIFVSLPHLVCFFFFLNELGADFGAFDVSIESGGRGVRVVQHESDRRPHRRRNRHDLPVHACLRHLRGRRTRPDGPVQLRLGPDGCKRLHGVRPQPPHRKLDLALTLQLLPFCRAAR